MTTRLIGPFKQLLTMDRLPDGGHLDDAMHLEVIHDAGIVVDKETISAVGPFDALRKLGHPFHEIPFSAVAMPGIIDAHTHLCFAGSRCHDYALRLQGCTYQEIAAQGGGILDTVKKTREASLDELKRLLHERTGRLLKMGVTTCEVKSGYGLTVSDELKMLQAINQVSKEQPVHLVPTCLAAHTKPPEFSTGHDYLSMLIQELLPEIIEQWLTRRIDIFVEKGAFSIDEARYYLKAAQKMGFTICVHADQFSRGGAALAAELFAASADHLEVSTHDDFQLLKQSGVVPIVLPGASLGLGMPLGPARIILDHGMPLVLASDWNPGSAPMGHLLMQAAVIGAAERLTMTETLAAITTRASLALRLHDRGILRSKMRADLIAFPCSDYREILYQQGAMPPSLTVIGGKIHAH